MKAEEFVGRCTQAAEALNRQAGRRDGNGIVAGLVAGLSVLRDSLYFRVHHDVEQIVGMDSMLAPVSESQTERVTKAEIEVFEIAVSSATVAQRGYLGTQNDWYRPWLAGLLLGKGHTRKVDERLDFYLSKSPDDRRLVFTDVLASALPESRRAPLVLFRLVPPAVAIATALAFGDRGGAAELRSQQIEVLPGIPDCHTCRGELLESGRQCPECGNPLWIFRWLTAAD